jgi:hypothetical protein
MLQPAVRQQPPSPSGARVIATDPAAAPTRFVRAVRLWWAVYLLLLPLYLGPSGYPQFSHIYLAATAPIVLAVCMRQVRLPQEVLFAGWAFLAYVACVNLYWFSIYRDSFFVMTIFYFTFNFLSMLIIVVIFRRDVDGLAQVTRLAFLAGLALEAGVVLVIGDEGYGRAMGTFNDPNQMGYWALLTVTCVLALREDRRLGAPDLLALALAGYVVFMSVSRAALLGYAVLLVMVLTLARIRLSVILGVLALAGIALALAHMLELGGQGQYQEVLGFAEKRFASRGMANDSLAERGYARLWRFPEHLIFGAGEGQYKLRFNLENETHSTIGAILFGYGIMGFLLFARLLFALLRRADRFRLALLVPIMVYGIAQQGVRFALFWMLLAFAYARSTFRDPADERFRSAS